MLVLVQFLVLLPSTSFPGHPSGLLLSDTPTVTPRLFLSSPMFYLPVLDLATSYATRHYEMFLSLLLFPSFRITLSLCVMKCVKFPVLLSFQVSGVFFLTRLVFGERTDCVSRHFCS